MNLPQYIRRKNMWKWKIQGPKRKILLYWGWFTFSGWGLKERDAKDQTFVKLICTLFVLLYDTSSGSNSTLCSSMMSMKSSSRILWLLLWSRKFRIRRSACLNIWGFQNTSQMDRVDEMISGWCEVKSQIGKSRIQEFDNKTEYMNMRVAWSLFDMRYEILTIGRYMNIWGLPGHSLPLFAFPSNPSPQPKLPLPLRIINVIIFNENLSLTSYFWHFQPKLISV